MSGQHKGKYRNESIRLQGWNYGSAAAYFITICTNDREHFFGEIKNGRMRVSPAGALPMCCGMKLKTMQNNPLNWKENRFQ